MLLLHAINIRTDIKYELHAAAETGNETKIEDILTKSTGRSRPARLDETDDNECTALHYAAANGHHGCLTKLEGADTNVLNVDGRTPLHYACANGHTECVQYLLQKSAEANTQDIYGRTSLHYSALGAYIRIIHALLDHGAHINSTDDHGWTALHYAVIDADNDCIRTLLQNEVNVNYRDVSGWTALHYTAARGHSKCFTTLLRAGADYTLKSKNGKSVADVATVGNQQVFRMLVEKHKKINQKIKQSPISTKQSCLPSARERRTHMRREDQPKPSSSASALVQRANTELKERVASLEASTSQVVRQLNNLSTAVNDVKTKQPDMPKHVQDLKVSIQRISNELTALRSADKSAEGGDTASGQIARLQQQLEAVTANIAGLHAEIKHVASAPPIIQLNPELIRQPRAVHIGKIYTSTVNMAHVRHMAGS